MMWLYRQRAA